MTRNAQGAFDQPTIRASLTLRGFGDDPLVVSELLGMQPTSSGARGDPLVGPWGQTTNRTVREAYWSVHSRCEPIEPLYRQLDNILEQIGNSASSFARLPVGATATVRCTVIPEDDLPILRVPSHTMARLAALGADLEIDILTVDGPIDS